MKESSVTYLLNYDIRLQRVWNFFICRFSIGQLPQWAKKQLTEENVQPSNFTKGVAAPKGRWAQRAENAMGVKSFYSSNPYPFPALGKFIWVIYNTN